MALRALHTRMLNTIHRPSAVRSATLETVVELMVWQLGVTSSLPA